MTSNVLESPRELPREWQATSVVRHIDDPISDSAFAEAEKTCIDLGPIDMAGCRGGFSDTLKSLREEANIYDDAPRSLVEAHQLFISAARIILGQERYLDSRIYFEYRNTPVYPGETQTDDVPHIDGPSRLVECEDQLTILGIACDVLPTVRFQGPLNQSQLEKGELKDLSNLDKRFTTDPIPVNHLILTPPSLMHKPGMAETSRTEPVDRLFLRWSLIT